MLVSLKYVVCPLSARVSPGLIVYREEKRDSSPTENQDSPILNNDIADYLLLCSEILHVVLKLH